MDQAWLEERVDAGRSFADIAREAGCSPAKVSYWARKFGIQSRHVRIYVSRGGMDEAVLRAFVARGLSIRQISAECGRSPTAVRHWLRRFGLQTKRADRVVPGEPLRECPTHGLRVFRRYGRSASLRCPLCASDRVARWRRRAKETLVQEAGGSCAVCGYDRYIGALQFHHLDPATKRVAFAERGLTRALRILRQEAEKCVLLCANCHAEVEAGLVRADDCPR
jgi:hypothetical protein